MKRPELRVESGALKGKRFSVPPEGLRLGRSSSNDVALHDEELSRNHCLFEPSGEEGLRVTDLASANGTYVNGRRVGGDPVELKAGDTVRVGTTHLAVVGEADSDMQFDLGLGKAERGTVNGERGTVNGEAPKSAKRRSPLMNVLWGVAALAFGGAIYVLLQPPAAPSAKTEEIREAPAALAEMRYEKIAADSETIFRYYMALTADGTLHVTIDDLSGEGRHINRSAPLKAAAKERLQEILSDAGFAALDREYVGPEEDPPRLNSWEIRYCTTKDLREVKVTNMPEPDAFRRVREKIEAFSMNELGIRALQYSRDQLLEMAHTAAATGRMKWEDRDVSPGNLFASIRAYREAIADLETVNPKPPEFAEYAEAMERATKELDERYKNQRFIVDQARSVQDWEKAKNELKTLCEMIPDREDERNREASAKLIDIEKRLGKKGGRR